MAKPPIRIDRYPGKMVTHLAERLMERYGSGADSLFDPYCGSSAILKAARDFGVSRISGLDINPYASLLSDVKLNGFCPKSAIQKYNLIKDIIECDKLELAIDWPMKNYWFTSSTLKKYELLRGAAHYLKLNETRSGRAVLLALALSVRVCSLADQRSPKPFISKIARIKRRGKHFDPIKKTDEILNLLCKDYGKLQKNKVRILCQNFVTYSSDDSIGNPFSHIMTSPPYINAQDYFRNWKLELYILENLLPFSVNDIRKYFVGTERGDLLANITEEEIEYHYKLIPQLRMLRKENKRLADVVHRYLNDMNKSITNIYRLLTKEGILVIVCGDNLIGNMKFKTSSVIEKIVKNSGFLLIDKFADKIISRQLAPRRHGHKGLIKEEMILAFQKF